MPERMELIDRGELAPSWGWWLLVLVGIVSLVAGGILVAKPSHSLATLSVVFGIFLLIDGIIELASSFGRGQENRALAAIFGLLVIVVGILLIRHPTTAVSARFPDGLRDPIPWPDRGVPAFGRGRLQSPAASYPPLVAGVRVLRREFRDPTASLHHWARSEWLSRLKRRPGRIAGSQSDISEAYCAGRALRD